MQILSIPDKITPGGEIASLSENMGIDKSYLSFLCKITLFFPKPRLKSFSYECE